MTSMNPSQSLSSDLDPESTPAPSDQRDITECLAQAQEYKSEGNQHYTAKKWNEAVFAYRLALGQLPKRAPPPIQPPPTGDTHSEEEGTSKSEPDVTEIRSPATDDNTERDPLIEECAKLRSVLNANIGACFVQLGDHTEVVDACTAALEDDPTYVKALQRRASSNDKLNTWGSLGKAKEDYETLLKILPPSSPDIQSINRSLKSLAPRLEAAQKKETEEMVSKLKGLGNSILGNFGLSTDNFKFEQNSAGGYSVKFNQ